MKWFIMLLVFIGGVYYLVNKRGEEMRQELLQKSIAAEEAQRQRIKTPSEPELPLKTEKTYVLRFSMQTLKTLRSLTSDPNDKVRFASVELLWQLQDEQAPALIKRLFQQETEPEVKRMLIEMLAKDKSRVSLALLAEALNDYDKDTRMRALDAIGTFSTKDAISVMTKAMKDYDEEVRLKAIQAINRVRQDIESDKARQMKVILEEQKTPRFKVD